ncbi:MFS transporter [Sphingosinicella sp. CPCC 101087]|uniref:MFS transporter n=1 Tax=Sphingosinicella sp. CPCC 101087 TaxID=2497754 RepID=UPI00101BAB9E|nr:MFS transporter [Sphingosinicella sp. CPCC 101087]
MAVAGSARGERSVLHWLMIAGIALAALTEAIASTALSLARGDILGDIHATPDEFAWLDMGYVALKLVGFAVAPWLLTRIEPRAALLAATSVMGMACACAAATARLDLLIILRMIQGLAGAILLVSGQAILFLGWSKSSQPVLQAIFATTAVVAPATIAPALQGWLIDNQSWTWILFGVLPVSLAAVGLMLMGEATMGPSPAFRPFDWKGLTLIAVALSSLTYVLSQGSRWDWFEESRIIWLSLVAGATLILLALWQKRVAERALLDLSPFKVDDFAFAFVVSFVAGAVLFGSAFLIPAFAVSVLGFTPTDAGLLLLPSGALFVVALLMAAFAMRAGRLPPIATVPFGILLIMIAMWMLSGANGESGMDNLTPAILLRGLGLGFLFLSITLVAFNRLPAQHLAFGIALFNIGRQLGGLIGVAGLQTLIDGRTAINKAVLGATLNPGSPALAERLNATASLFTGRGMDPEAAARAATQMLERILVRQSTVIAFDTAFAATALVFVVAVPLMVAFKLLLARMRPHRPSR